jgi:uracil-DNA glycosylase family 4
LFHCSGWPVSVIPAQAGIQYKINPARLDAGLRRYDEQEAALFTLCKTSNDNPVKYVATMGSSMTASQDKAAARALLAWYEAMGADEGIGEAPLDRFAGGGAPKAVPARAAPERKSVASAPRSTPRATALVRAPTPSPRGIGGQAATLAELQALVAQFDGCSLKRTAKSLCFARGSEQASIMLIGEAPGRDEDLQGKPFVGRAGQLLDRMLASVGLGEEQVYIANTVYWRPPGNRTPSPEEIAACAPFLARQIELLSPKLLVLLGGAAAKSILGVNEGIMRLRGKWLTYSCGGRDIPTLATLHPAFLLRKPEQKRYAWRDLLMLKAALDT